LKKTLICNEAFSVKFPAGASIACYWLDPTLGLGAVIIQARTFPKKQFNCSLRIMMNYEVRNYPNHHFTKGDKSSQINITSKRVYPASKKSGKSFYRITNIGLHSWLLTIRMKSASYLALSQSISG
jgi:hypothetical protein